MIAEFGDLDILVNNAGIQRRSPVTEFPEKDWNNVLDISSNNIIVNNTSVSAIIAQVGESDAQVPAVITQVEAVIARVE